MQRYVALLRGISPINCTMADLERAFEAAGFSDVKTVLGTGNVVFGGPAVTETAIESKAEAAMQKVLGRKFFTIVRQIDALVVLLKSDPYSSSKLSPEAKRVVTFLRDAPTPRPKLPIERDGATILKLKGREVFTAYAPSARGAVFMVLIEKTFGKDVTTRTWDTLRKIARAAVN